MKDFINIFLDTVGISGEASIPLLLFLILLFGFIRIIGSKDNPIEFWHFFASYNKDTGKERGDVNSLGLIAGVVICLFSPLWIVYKTNDVPALVLGLCLIYLGGVKVFAVWLRSAVDRKYTGTKDNEHIPSKVL